jgi:hypothetical protein
VSHDTAGADPTTDQGGTSRRSAIIAIFVISLAGLLLEVAYTRVISYKLWYYYTYLVIGLALLGIGSGSTIVVLSSRIRAASTAAVLRWSSILGAVSIVVGYFVIAAIPVDTLALWDYGTGASFKNFAALAAICFVLFATFIAIGIMVSTLLSRGGDDVSRLYFSDLIGAGLACALVVFLITRIGPPAVIILVAFLLAVVGLAFTDTTHRVMRIAGIALVVLLGAGVVFNDVLPDPRPESSKVQPPEGGSEFSDWGPVFRVDVAPVPGRETSKWLIHDGTYGSAIHEFDGDVDSLTRFDEDPRSWPFNVLGDPASRQLIIGSAGGNEILASLYHDSEIIDAVELNPVTVKLVEETYKDYTGDLTSFPQVNLTQGDGRSFLARSSNEYDLVWFVAPDSYAANNAASSGAFVLSESYLYTADMIEETLDHLSDDGITVAQFGEVDFDDRPNRTARYLVTAREAMEDAGIEDPSQHMLVATSEDPLSGGLSTIMLKRTPFTPEEVERFTSSIDDAAAGRLVYAPGVEPADSIVAEIAAAPDTATVDALIADYPFDVSAITDDGPFFWHFVPFNDVLRDILDPIQAVDRENAVGERVLLLLLAIATLFAIAFLLLPFLVVRKQWRELPAKGVSAVYFAALGLGFMLYEITMIQRLTEYLGFPTYSLTVTLASILIFTGLGALWSGRFADEPRRVVPKLVGALLVLTVFYRFALGPITIGTLNAPLGLRILLAFVLLAPLGLILGMFMPLGLRTVGVLSKHPDEYVAWGWAINGVFSVIGSVLTTILSMTFGFRTVQLIAVVAYLIAAVALWRLQASRPPVDGDDTVDLTEPDDGGAMPALRGTSATT